MIRPATVPLRGVRTNALIVPIIMRGIDLTDAVLTAVVLQKWDNSPEYPELEPTVTLDSVEDDDGVPVSNMTFSIPLADMEQVEDAAEIGTDLNWVWALDFQTDDEDLDTKQRYLEGPFIVGGTAGGTGGAGTIVATVADQTISIEIDGASALGPLVEAATEAAAGAAASETAAAASAAAAAVSETAASGYASAALAMINPFTSIALGLAGTPNGGVFTVLPQTNGTIPIYRDNAGTEQLLATMFGTLNDHLGRATAPTQLLGTRSLGFHLPKALDDVQRGARYTLTILVLGDSLGMIDYYNGPEQLARNLQGWFKDRPVMYPTLDGGFNDGAGSTRFVTGSRSTATLNTKTDYPSGYTGSNVSLPPGTVATFSGTAGGGALNCNRILIPIQRAPGGPTYKIEIASGSAAPAIGSGSWVSPVVGQIASAHSLTGSDLLVSADAAAGIEWVELSVAFGTWSYRLTNTSGSVTGKAYNGWLKIDELALRSAINIVRFAEGSNYFLDEVSGAQTYMAPYFAMVQPDIILLCSDDDLAGYQNFLPLLESTITAAALTYKPLVMCPGNPTNATADIALAARQDWVAGFCATRLGWIAPDLVAITGGLAEVTREDVEGDGTHPWATNDVVFRVAWTKSLRQYGLTPAPTGGTASIRDMNRGVGDGAITANGLRAMLAAPTTFDTSAMTWSTLPSATGTMTVNADKSMTLTTGATANFVTGAYINEINPYFGRANGSRPLSLEGGFSIWVKPVTANATGVARCILANDRSYNAAHTGALTGNGVGFKFEDGTVWGIYWNGSAETKSTLSHTLTTNQFDDFQLVMTALPNSTTVNRIEWFANGVSLGTADFRKTGSASSLRWEATQTNGATYVLRVSAPKLVNLRG